MKHSPLFLLLSLSLAACTTEPLPTDDHRVTWSERAVQDYSFEYETYDTAEWIHVRVVVDDGAVAHVMPLVRHGTASLDPTLYPTIEDLFDEVDAAVELDPDLAVTYDPTLGHPTALEDNFAVRNFIKVLEPIDLEPIDELDPR